MSTLPHKQIVLLRSLRKELEVRSRGLVREASKGLRVLRVILSSSLAGRSRGVPGAAWSPRAGAHAFTARVGQLPQQGAWGGNSRAARGAERHHGSQNESQTVSHLSARSTSQSRRQTWSRETEQRGRGGDEGDRETRRKPGRWSRRQRWSSIPLVFSQQKTEDRKEQHNQQAVRAGSRKPVSHAKEGCKHKQSYSCHLVSWVSMWRSKRVSGLQTET